MTTTAFTFGRFNILHPGHVELVQKMLSVADNARVYISTGKLNNDWDTRVLLFRHLLRAAEVDLRRVKLLKASNPWEAVEDALTVDFNPVVVLGHDQAELLWKLSDDFDLACALNQRSTSSTAVRHLLDRGEVDLVRREVYRNDTFATRLAEILRNEELTRETRIASTQTA